MSTSIIIKIVIDPRSNTEQQQSYIYLLTVGKNNNSAVLQTTKIQSRVFYNTEQTWGQLQSLNYNYTFNN